MLLFYQYRWVSEQLVLAAGLSFLEPSATGMWGVVQYALPDQCRVLKALKNVKTA